MRAPRNRDNSEPESTMRRTFAVLAAFWLAICPAATLAQQPDRRGEVVTDTPEYQGVRANAPIPPQFHIRNEGGSNGAGLCVIASILANGQYQGVPGLEVGKESELWRAAKAAPGGYYPGKLEALLNRVLPGEKWFSWEGDGTDLLARYSAEGYPIGATMNTGQLYHYLPIHHMVSLAHLDDRWACVVDNNDPGKYHWMPRSEYNRRFPDGGVGWGFIWLRRVRRFGRWAPWIGAGLMALAAYVVAARRAAWESQP